MDLILMDDDALSMCHTHCALNSSAIDLLKDFQLPKTNSKNSLFPFEPCLPAYQNHNGK